MIKYDNLTIKGIDVSQYNDSINWSKVRGDFVAIRAGYGRVTDKRFVENWKNAKGKLFRMPYWYLDYYSNHDKTSTAHGISDKDWGARQAELCWSLIKDDNEGIVWLDIESTPVADATVQDVWSRVMTIAASFFEKMDALNGRKNGIYSSLSLLPSYTAEMRGRPLWVAWYTHKQSISSVLTAVQGKGWTGSALIWQYASDGDTDGDGTGDGKDMGMPYKWLDLNVWLGNIFDWEKFRSARMILNIEPLSQSDARWKNDKLGTSNTTIGGYGCLITSVSMMLRHLGFDTDPARLNTLLKNNGGFHSGNLFVWGSLSALYPGVKFAYRYSGSATDKINASLAAGMPVIVHVDYNPSTPAIDEHWVLVVGRQGDDYIINDPKDGKQLLFSTRYGVASKNIHTVCTYNFSGIVPPVEPEPEPSPIEAGQVVATLVNLNIRKGAGTKYGVWATAPKGTKLDVLEIRGDWVRVGWNQWALSRYNGVRYLG